MRIVTGFSRDCHSTTYEMLKIAVAAFATAIDESGSLKIGEQLADFARHASQYRDDTIKVNRLDALTLNGNGSVRLRQVN
jgi:hypothetical protein